MKSKNLNIILLIILIVSFMFKSITLNLNKNMELSLGLFLYSITFIISSIMIKNNKISDCKKTLFKSSLYLLLFYFIITILSNFNIDSTLMNSMRNIFTPNNFTINKLIIYYPNLINLFTYLLVFYLSHYIFFVTYEVLEINTNKFISFFVSILIAFILDQIIYTSLTNIIPLFSDKITINTFVKELTNNFFICLTTSCLLSLINPLFNVKKEKN